MATTRQSGTVAPPFGDYVKMTSDLFELLHRAGLLPERYELIDEELIGKAGQNHPHAFRVIQLTASFTSVFDSPRVVTQATVNMTDEGGAPNKPEPDIIVRQGVRRDPEYWLSEFKDRCPTVCAGGEKSASSFAPNPPVYRYTDLT